jgi:hypothetical protein
MLPGPVKIFAFRKVPRLCYVADLILNEILGLSWQIITDRRKTGKSPVINYSGSILPGTFRISPSEILFETGIKTHEISISNWNGLPIFFNTDEESDLPFDIFAATFFMVTRYEEYLGFSPDEHGRFCGSESLAYKNGFLDIPIINLWAREFAKVLVRKYQTLSFKPKEFRALVTIDVDEPFAYKGRNMMGNIAGLVKDFAARGGRLSEHMDFIKGKIKDPYEVFDFLADTIKSTGSTAKFFFPVGDTSVYDRNPSWRNSDYRQLIRKIKQSFTIGLHPSYKASTDLPALVNEAERFKTITNNDLLVSRFHFLKIKMPGSYRNLSAAGIHEDYSMGFHDEPGFRAGIACPFLFYDILDDKLTNLRIYPFQIMDVTLREYKKYKPREAIEIIRRLLVHTQSTGGIFISIWHNTTLLEKPELKEWCEVFEFTLRNQVV